MWEADFETLDENLLEDYISNIKLGRTQSDILYEILLKYGLDLTLPIKEHTIAGQKVFDISMGALIICLSDAVDLDVVEGIAGLKEELKPEIMRVVFKDSGFDGLVGLFEQTQTAMQTQAARAVNSSLVARNWLSGWYIVEFEKQSSDRAEIYGKNLMAQLSERLTAKLGKGFSRRSLNQFRQFYELEAANGGWSLRELKHQDLGQMQMYVNYFDRYVKLEDEKPTIGIILCKKKKDSLVKITLPEGANIHAAKYQTYLPDKEALKRQLENAQAEWEAYHENQI